MTTSWASTYPVAIDPFTPALLDGVDDVIANHPNTLAAAITSVETKLGITNTPITGLGGASFSALGKAAFPGVAGSPTVWVDNSAGPGFILTYTDDLGVDYEVLTTGSTSLQDVYEGGNTIVTTAPFGDFDVSGVALVTLASSSVSASAISLAASAGGVLISSANLTKIQGGGGFAELQLLSTGATINCYSGTLLLNAGGADLTLNATGVLSLNSSAGVINIGNNAVAQAINIGTGAAARVITIGNATGATALDIDAGTGGIALDTTGGLSIDASGVSSNITLTATGAGHDFTIGLEGAFDSSLILTSRGTATDALQILAIAGGIEAESTKTFSIKTSTGSGSNVNITADNRLNLTSSGAAVGDTTIGSSGSVNIQSSLGNSTINTISGDLILFASDQVRIQGAEVSSTAVLIEATNAAGGIDINSGTGGFRLDTTGVISIDSTYNHASAINITTNGGASEKIVITNTQGTDAAAIDINATAGGVDIDGAGRVSLNSSAGAISIGDDAVAQAISIGTAGARVINIGGSAATSLSMESTGTISLNSSSTHIVTMNPASNFEITAGSGNLELYGSSSELTLQDSYLAAAISVSETGVTAIPSGYNSTSIVGCLSEDRKVALVSAATYALATDVNSIHVAYTGTGSVVITVPDSVIDSKSGKRFTIIDTGGNSSVNNITVNTATAQLINGEANAVIDVDYASVTFESNGTDLFVR